jgi:hypothetical protein
MMFFFLTEAVYFETRNAVTTGKGKKQSGHRQHRTTRTQETKDEGRRK